jgi:hypothetical protein
MILAKSLRVLYPWLDGVPMVLNVTSRFLFANIAIRLHYLTLFCIFLNFCQEKKSRDSLADLTVISHDQQLVKRIEINGKE